MVYPPNNKKKNKRQEFKKQEYKKTGIQETRKQVLKAYTKKSRILTRRRVFYTREGGGEVNATQHQAQTSQLQQRAVVEVWFESIQFYLFCILFSVWGQNCVSLKNLRTRVVDSSRAPLLFLMMDILILLISVISKWRWGR